MENKIMRELEPSSTFGCLRKESEAFDLDDSFDSQGVSETIERWKD